MNPYDFGLALIVLLAVWDVPPRTVVGAERRGRCRSGAVAAVTSIEITTPASMDGTPDGEHEEFTSIFASASGHSLAG